MKKYKYLPPLIQTSTFIKGGLFTTPRVLEGAIGKPIRIEVKPKKKRS